MNTTTTPHSPDDDPNREAAILIGKLTVLIGDLKKQIDANAAAIVALEKLVHAHPQQVAGLLGENETKAAQRQNGYASEVRAAIADLTKLTEDRVTGLHARLIMVIVAVVAFGVVALVRLFA